MNVHGRMYHSSSTAMFKLSVIKYREENGNHALHYVSLMFLNLCLGMKNTEKEKLGVSTYD